MKKTEGEEDFYVGADDSNFYQAQAIEKIDSASVTKKSAERQFLKLIGNQNRWTLDIRKKICLRGISFSLNGTKRLKSFLPSC